MKPNACYSALGRIRRLFIFDTTQYVISETSQFPFEEVRNNYSTLAQSLNKFNTDEKAELFIFFTINPYARLVMPMTDVNLGIHFIPVNMVDPDASIPTSWIQDTMFVSSDGSLFLSAFYFSNALKNVIGQYAESTNVQFFKRKCPGGNILRGRLNGEDYLLHGYAPWKDCNPYYLSKAFHIKMSRITKVFDDDMRGHDELFFHVDLYSTIVGPVDKEGNELVLLGKCDALKYPDVRKALDDLEQRLQRMPSTRASDNKQFIFENLPFIVLKGSDGKIEYALSYNNCLVENFIDSTGQRRIRIYFPDYHDEIMHLAQESAENELIMTELIEDLIAAAYTNNMNSGIDAMQQTLRPQITAKYLDGIHNVIRHTLAKYGITEIEFVKHDFRLNANRLGSLRCMTKVIARDCME